MELAGVVDDLKEGKDFFGRKVAGIEALKEFEFDRIFITALSSKENIYQKLIREGVPEDKIILI